MFDPLLVSLSVSVDVFVLRFCTVRYVQRPLLHLIHSLISTLHSNPVSQSRTVPRSLASISCFMPVPFFLSLPCLPYLLYYTILYFNSLLYSHPSLTNFIPPDRPSPFSILINSNSSRHSASSPSFHSYHENSFQQSCKRHIAYIDKYILYMK